jgi:hypothetical protein
MIAVNSLTAPQISMQTPRRLPGWFFTLLLLPFLLAVPPSGYSQFCGSSDNTYQFVNWCTHPVWLAERSTADPTAYPPQSGNWAVAGLCTDNAACPSGLCDVNGGRCTCTTPADCPGGAVCEADGKCGNVATICVPQNWSSGTFWPRTGCTLDDSVTPATLACDTGACFNSSGTALLDCSVGNGGGSPTNPVTQFEVTSSTASVNYDVSIAAGYNVETKATPVGGGLVVPGTPSTDVVACYDAGCTADLNATCPEALQVVESGQVIGCLDPCTRCQRSDPPAALQCDTLLSDQWTSCTSTTGSVTYEDLYCAKNFSDGNPQASPNQGTPTAFSQLDCAPVTSFVTPTFVSSYTLPAGQGVCLYTSAPQSTISNFNDYGWADAQSGTTKNCGGSSPLPDGTACGGYLTVQSDGSYYTDAIGYTCQTATYPLAAGGTQTAHLCMPPTTTGLGVCTEDLAGGLPLYSGTGGVANAAWITAATAAGGGTTPYYVPFKIACEAAYAWQYDDIASGFGCTVASTVGGNSTFTGFDVSFCSSNLAPTLTEGVPDLIIDMDIGGRVKKLDREGRGKLRMAGQTKLPVGVALTDITLSVSDLLDEVGAKGELIDTGNAPRPLPLPPRKRNAKKAIFETEAGVEPHVKVILRRPKTSSETVNLRLKARGLTIARPAGCEGTATEVSLETALNLRVEQARQHDRPLALQEDGIAGPVTGKKLMRLQTRG